MLYSGGSLLCFGNDVGGWRSDVVSSSGVEVGVDAGGVSSWRGEGRGPGEQWGICLLGTAVGVPRWEVLMLRWPGGGVLRPGSGAGRASMVAIACVVKVGSGATRRLSTDQLVACWVVIVSDGEERRQRGRVRIESSLSVILRPR